MQKVYELIDALRYGLLGDVLRAALSGGGALLMSGGRPADLSLPSPGDSGSV